MAVAVIINNQVGGTIRMKISHGSGFLNQNWPVANTWGSSAYTWVADFNKDGLADFASANDNPRVLWTAPLVRDGSH